MTVVAITFNTAENKLVVLFEDDTTKEFSDAATYLAVLPDRYNDVKAMGWV